jgi:hypothetical protein
LCWDVAAAKGNSERIEPAAYLHILEKDLRLRRPMELRHSLKEFVAVENGKPEACRSVAAAKPRKLLQQTHVYSKPLGAQVFRLPRWPGYKHLQPHSPH